MMAGLNYVAHGGTYVLVSVVRDAICFPDPEFHKRETSLLGSRNATPEDFAKVSMRCARASCPPRLSSPTAFRSTRRPQLPYLDQA